jgi:hypothetical protein
VGSLADHAARGSAGGFLAKLTDAEVRRWRVTASIWVTTCKGTRPGGPREMQP